MKSTTWWILALLWMALVTMWLSGCVSTYDYIHIENVEIVVGEDALRESVNRASDAFDRLQGGGL